MSFYVSIRTIAPQGKLPPVKVGVWIKVRVSFRVGGNQKIAHDGNCPPVTVRIWLRVSFGVGEGNFLLQNIFFREHLWATGSKYNLKTFFSH